MFVGLKTQALLLSILVFTVLELWRPCFFLTDDSLSGGMPVLSEMGEKMWAGKNFFDSDYLFGGHYYLPADSVFLIWHPMYLIAAFVGQVIASYYLSDILAFINMQVAVIGFVTVAELFRKEYNIRLSDPMLLFFSISFTYNLYILNVGSSWGNFNVNHSVLPWLVFAIWQKQMRAGWGICSLVLLHEFLGGHTVMSISTAPFMSVLVAGYALQTRSWRPVLIWISGNVTAAIMALPILVPALEGFSHSHRAEGLSLGAISALSMPLENILIGLFWGAWTSIHLIQEGVVNVMPNSSFPGSAAAWCLIPALLTGRRLSKLDQLLALLIVVVVIMVVRPEWISVVLSRVPLLKSMRWPFREILQLQFFLHLFLVSRGEGEAGKFKKEAIGFGLLVFLAPLFIGPIPTINQTRSDRRLIFSGEARQFWTYVKTRLKPGEMIVPIVKSTFPLEEQSDDEVPECLLGDCNYPAYLHVLSASGYSPAAPLNQTALGLTPFWPYGAYSDSQIPDILRVAGERKLSIRFIVLVSNHPLTIFLTSPDGTSEDLSSHLPDWVRQLKPSRVSLEKFPIGEQSIQTVAAIAKHGS